MLTCQASLPHRPRSILIVADAYALQQDGLLLLDLDAAALHLG